VIVKLEVYSDGEYWCARGLGVDIFTQGKTYEQLLENIKEATALHFEESQKQGERIQVLILSELELPSVYQTA